MYSIVENLLGFPSSTNSLIIPITTSVIVVILTIAVVSLFGGALIKLFNWR